MNSFPILETERLRLRELQHEDAEELYLNFSKDEVTEYYDLDSFTKRTQAESLIKMWKEKYLTGQSIRWGIALKNEERIIGTCGFHNWSKKHARAEIGYELSPQHWRNGIMTEALRSVIGYGFGELELNRIGALIAPDNTGSRRLLKKLEFNEEGRLNEYYCKKEKFIDVICFSRLQRK